MDPGVLSAMLAVTLARATERLMLVLAGMLAIWLGYRLFTLLPQADKSGGKIQLPGGVSIFLTRIGPGVFFALFGCAIIGYSVTRPFDLHIPAEIAATRPDAVQAAAGRAIQLSGIGPTAPFPSTGANPPAGVPDVGVLLGRLNYHFQQQSARMDPLPREEWEQALRQARLALMLRYWKPSWGDRDAFIAWVNEGARIPGPPILAGAINDFTAPSP